LFLPSSGPFLSRETSLRTSIYSFLFHLREEETASVRMGRDGGTQESCRPISSNMLRLSFHAGESLGEFESSRSIRDTSDNMFLTLSSICTSWKETDITAVNVHHTIVSCHPSVVCSHHICS
jgi:hypothetical protein